ncbi:hypothetical protein DV704_04110 [Meiothermus sp. QL-1]|nr:hypothetical protein DV704_04110 [Meiothermus sp. QL-1]
MGNGAWQALSFQNGQASFQAQGTVEYEVALRCSNQGFGRLLFFKASTSQTRQVDLTCSSAQTPSQNVLFTFNLTLPAQVGSTQIQDGDLVYVNNRQGAVSSGSASITAELPQGQQEVWVGVFRPGSNPMDLTPIGGKLVQVNVTANGSANIDDQGYQAFALKQISASLPQGFTGAGSVAFFKNGMREPGWAGLGSQYGVLSGAGGKYVGLYQAGASSSASAEELGVWQETGGNDWNVPLPAPWGSQGPSISNNARTYTLAYPNAQVFTLDLSGLAQDGNTPFQILATVYPSGSSTTYTLPDLQSELSYTYATSGTASYQVRAYTHIQGLELFGSTQTLDENVLQGLHVAYAGKSGQVTVQ